MMGERIWFYGTAIVLLASSLGVVLAPNLFHAVLYLAAALVATAVVFLLLQTPFLFAVQLLLYAGGVVTVVVFAIMLTERLIGERITQSSRYVINGAIVSGAVFIAILGFLAGSLPAATPAGTAAEQVTAIGHALVGPYAVTLEVLGVLLVAGLIGATHFARSED